MDDQHRDLAKTLQIPFRTVSEITFTYSGDSFEVVHMRNDLHRNEIWQYLHTIFPGQVNSFSYTPDVFQSAKPMITGGIVLTVVYLALLFSLFDTTPNIGEETLSIIVIIHGLAYFGNTVNTIVFFILGTLIFFRIRKRISNRAPLRAIRRKQN